MTPNSTKSHLGITLGCGIGVIVFHGWFAAWLHLSLTSERYSHLAIVPLIAVALVFSNRKQIFSEIESARDGLAIVATAVAIEICARYLPVGVTPADRLTIPTLGIVLLFAGLFRLFYGRRAWRAAAFPILFLLSMVPVPTVVLDRSISVLRTGSAAVVSGLFTLFRVPFVRTGMRFDLPGVSIEIAEQCSGIRSSIALLLVTSLLGYMALHSNWRRWVLAASVVPLVFFKNGLRIVTLSWLAINVDPRFLTGAPHHQGGFVFFGLMLAMVFLLCHLLRRREGLRFCVGKRIEASPPR